ncbi:MAG: hypothetical protein HYR71_06920 [Chloroflexi bacterium]|nr:hypothetical protein [Chloroflexota bacterium]
MIQAIRRTIAYADLFDQAITPLDIHRYLEVAASVADVRAALDRHDGTAWVRHDGLYCLPGRYPVIETTLQRRQDAAKIWGRAKRWAAIMSHVPFVRMVAVTGSLSMHNMKPGSDMDFFIVTAHGRVWLTRMLLVILVRFARLLHDELCPNYLLSANALTLNDRSYFTAREFVQMIPLYGLNVYREMRALNRWALEFLPAAEGAPTGPIEIRLGRPAQAVKGFLEALLRSPVGDWLETWEQRRKIKRLRRLPGADSSSVALSADECKGHFNNTNRRIADHRTQFLV